jgi:hypothetical protein
MKPFKYKTLPMFLDADQVPCIFSLDVMTLFDIPDEDVYRMSWDIGGRLVMTVHDFSNLHQQLNPNLYL